MHTLARVCGDQWVIRNPSLSLLLAYCIKCIECDYSTLELWKGIFICNLYLEMIMWDLFWHIDSWAVVLALKNDFSYLEAF